MDIEEFEKQYREILNKMKKDVKENTGFDYKLEVTEEEIVKFYIGALVLNKFNVESLEKVMKKAIEKGIKRWMKKN